MFTEVEIYFAHCCLMVSWMLALAAYLLLSQRNAFGKEIIINQRLRREAGKMILIYAAVYILNIPILLVKDSFTLQMLSLTLDMAIGFPAVFRFMFTLLQDRPRWSDRLWLTLFPVALIPLAGWLLSHNTIWMWVLAAVYAAEIIFTGVYYYLSVLKYKAFLMDNYADLEHKEVRWSSILLLLLGIVLACYVLAWKYYSAAWWYAFLILDMMFLGIVAWRIDKQQVLSTEEPEATSEAEAEAAPDTPQNSQKDTNDIVIYRTGKLLEKYCVLPGLYLKNDLTKDALAKACSTNRTYLSRYFASQGVTYNAYINQLRIKHFQEAYLAGGHNKGTLKQLASDCGFSSYDTFSRAFLTYTGIPLREWLHQVAE